MSPDFYRMHAHRCRMTQRGIPVPPMEIAYCLFEYSPVSPSGDASATEAALKDENLRLRQKLSAL